MSNNTMLIPELTVGLDLGDRLSHTYAVDAAGQCVGEGTVATMLVDVRRCFGALPRCRVVLEVGTHSPWISRELARLGHEVVVANPSAVYGKGRRRKRNDRMDAEFLARQGRADPRLLCPIQHRGRGSQEKLELLRARDQLVRVRARLINHVRGTVKSLGQRISRCSAEAFARRAGGELCDELRPTMAPLLEVIGDLSRRIDTYDKQVEKLAQQYPAAERLRQLAGVGALTAVAYILLVEDPRRFRKSRDAGAYFGLVPRLDESSDSKPQLRISKAGDELGRRLLVSAAHYIMGPFGPECDLRRHGEAIAGRGGKNARKRAVIAVARKLAVLLHRLWITGDEYNPDRLLKRRMPSRAGGEVLKSMVGSAA